MINLLWAAMILIGISWSAFDGEMEKITSAIFRYAGEGLSTSLNLLAIVTVWFGISRIAEKAGLLSGLARLMTPILRPLFPEVPRQHKAVSSIAMNLTANVLGLAHGATPFGLKAMRELQQLNRRQPDTVSPSMVTFLAINSAVATLVPTTAIALRANAGASHPSAVIVPAAAASGLAMVAVLLADRFLRYRAWRR